MKLKPDNQVGIVVTEDLQDAVGEHAANDSGRECHEELAYGHCRDRVGDDLDCVQDENI